MNIHKNARTTPKMRALIVERHQAGQTPRAMASAVGVCPASVQKWIVRFKTEGSAGLHYLFFRPHRLQTTVNAAQRKTIEALRRARQPTWKGARRACPAGDER